MTRRADENDREFERLFRSLDEVKASNELKESTLAAIFDRMDEAEKSADDMPSVLPTFKLVGKDTEVETEPFVTASEAEPEPATELPAEPASEPGPAPEADPALEPTSVTRRKPRRWPKIAAVIIVVALGVSGLLAYAMPTSHVVLAADDTTFDLGINVFGQTVSATSNSDVGKAAISSANVHNTGYEDALNRLLDTYERQRNAEPSEVSVTVHDKFGGRNDEISRGAERVLEERGEPQEASEADQMPTESTGPGAAPGAPSEGGGAEALSASGETLGVGGQEAQGFGAPEGGAPEAFAEDDFGDDQPQQMQPDQGQQQGQQQGQPDQGMMPQSEERDFSGDPGAGGAGGGGNAGGMSQGGPAGR